MPFHSLVIYTVVHGTFEDREAMASKDGKVNAYKTSEDDESSSGGTAESESTDVFEKIRRLFGDDIYDSLQSKS